MRIWRTLAGAVAGLLLVGAGGAGGGSAPGGPGEAIELPLTVMTFNIRYANAGDGENRWERRRDLVAGVVERHSPDVLGLQEALKPQLDELVERAGVYTVVGVGRDDGKESGEFSPILVRSNRFEVLESGTFWLSETPEKPGSVSWGNTVTRICTWARLAERTPSCPVGEPGQPMNVAPPRPVFWVFNTHLDHQSQSSREKGAELIAARIGARGHGEEPVILMGDFNAGEDNAAVALFTRSGKGDGGAAGPRMVDSYRAEHPGETVVGTFNGFGDPGDAKTTGGAKIDYILVPPPPRCVVEGASIDRTNEEGRYPSDHFAVTASLRLRCPTLGR
ncbi:MAG: endonuclease/exonuclease/phosphatase family protein [Phycisphaeraceae bacterium]|nr:endonuclease/exonuclease/phosphatase family protein [Phycisphaeraceae bacterium]